MCGIAGIFRFKKSGEPELHRRATRVMSQRMFRRGPDDSGHWDDPEERLFLGFRRLSILDLSELGHQPMVSSDGRSIIVFNGEIYNYSDLRDELIRCGISFRSNSDTEVLLEALNLWGTSIISKLNGMFAFGWYDRREHRLVLARDHAGIKPLYYGYAPRGEGIVFGSQFDLLSLSPWGRLGAIRPSVLNLYLRLQHIPPPYGLDENTYQLSPGEMLEISSDGRSNKRRWWQLPEEDTGRLTADAALERVQAALDNSVRRQRIADVPLGVFLSGGIDSPLVAALAREQVGPGLKSFTIGNPGWRQDESSTAAGFAKHLDLDARVYNASGEDCLKRLPDVVAAQHEPFADFSILPALQVCQFAKSEVTVALSGDGGDELFFGYERPHSLLRNGLDFRYPRLVRTLLYALGRYGLAAKRSETIIAKDPGAYYFGVNCRVSEGNLRSIAPGLECGPADFDLYSYGMPITKRDLANYSRRVEFYGQMQRCLKKVDMASMQMSLEVRVPFLDREVIDASLECDSLESMEGAQRKVVLHRLLSRYIPAGTIPTAKRGFAVPVGDWLKGALRSTVEDTLFGGDLYPSGLFQKREIERLWKQHTAGHCDNKWLIWTLLCLQWWSRRQN